MGAEAPSQVFARRMRHYRERRGWTQSDLADRLTGVGWKVDRAQLARIEAAGRGISLDEAVIIAWTLGVPPALLYLPLGEVNNVALAPEVVVHPEAARRWVKGDQPAITTDRFAHLPGEWKSDMAVWWWHDDLISATDNVYAAEREIRSATYVGNSEQIEEAKKTHVETLRTLAQVLDEIRARGWIPPEMPQATVDYMKKVGINYDGPTYDPGEPDPRRNFLPKESQ